MALKRETTRQEYSLGTLFYFGFSKGTWMIIWSFWIRSRKTSSVVAQSNTSTFQGSREEENASSKPTRTSNGSSSSPRIARFKSEYGLAVPRALEPNTQTSLPATNSLRRVVTISYSSGVRANIDFIRCDLLRSRGFEEPWITDFFSWF